MTTPAPHLFAALTNSTWDNLSDVGSLLVVGLFIIAGVLLGYALRGLVGRWQAEAIEKKMRLREDEAEADIKARLKEADIAARAAVVKAREAFEASVKKRKEEQQAIEDRQTAREANLDRKAALLDARDAETKATAAAAEQTAAEAAKTSAKADALLTSVAKMTHEEARRTILEQTHEALRDDAESLSRRIQEAARERGEAVARQIVADAIQRCAVAHLNETTVSSVTITDPSLKGRIVGRDGRNVRAFEAATGVSVLLDDTPDTVVLSAFDPVRRETARRALEALIADGRIHPASIEAAVANARSETDSANAEAGESAAAEANVPGLSAETLRLMGALRLRTSFSQNVLRHSVEVALLAGTMAAELGLDAATARRVGFLHDIGKALTDGKNGSHAALGADFLKLHGEAETVWKAVAAHHDESGVDGGIYGTLCAAADAISSARPGARQENAAAYAQRLADIESIAQTHRGVTSVFAVQAGRDLRVLVDPGAVSDADAGEMARTICREIAEQVKFPGQIRVTVIRELRCTEYAK